MQRSIIVTATVFTLLALGSTDSTARELSFEDRVDAQAAIERVRYAHQIGASKPFAEALPRVALENKVRTYLQQSVALERFWRTPVTAETLQQETERIVNSTRMPWRLREIFYALGNDPVLIHECLARSILVERLTRSFYPFDTRIHAAARREAEDLQNALASGELDPNQDHALRTEIEVLRPSSVPRAVGEIGATEEDSEALRFRVVLYEDEERVRIAIYRVEKRLWDEWWGDVSPGLDQGSVTTIARADASIPEIVLNLAPAERSGFSSDDTWDHRSPQAEPDQRLEHSAVWTGSEMIVWGGVVFDFPAAIGSTFLRSGGRYDPATDTWTPMSTMGAPEERMQHTAIWTGSEMIVWGGSIYGFPTDTGGRYDPATDSWTPTSTTGAPEERNKHTAIWTGSEMVAWGGTSFGNSLGSGGRYDPATDHWAPTSTVGAPSGRDGHTAIWTGSEMIAWGGEGAVAILNTGGRYDPATDSWTSTTAADAPAARSGHTAVWTGSSMLIQGGDGGLVSGGRYDPAADAWVATSIVGAPMDGNNAVWTGTLMLVWGASGGVQYDPATEIWTAIGGPSNSGDQKAVWTGRLMIVWGGLSSGGRYDPATGSWRPTTTNGAPLRRAFHSPSVWTGNFMIVWGGEGGVPLVSECQAGTGSRGGGVCGLNTGSRYDPVTDHWAPTSMIEAPSRRDAHTVVWTGDEMLVWGGSRGADRTGARYDPLVDGWTPTSLVGAPSDRLNPTSVWTGDEMVVWGGRTYGELPVNTGGRYDPATDNWTPISTTGAPSARQGHAAIWTGNRMVVWGGGGEPMFGDEPAAVNTGALYDPQTDSWTPMSIDGAPPGRYLPSAMWTGSLMLAWGGRTTSNYPDGVDTGGRYDPATNSWTPITMAGAPTSRYGHTAVWTGEVMAVWGGSSSAFSHSDNTGGRYDPQADSWTPISTGGTPAPRLGHTAVWTGKAMIVWGGYDNEVRYYTNTGGWYNLGESVGALRERGHSGGRFLQGVLDLGLLDR